MNIRNQFENAYKHLKASPTHQIQTVLLLHLPLSIMLLYITQGNARVEAIALLLYIVVAIPAIIYFIIKKRWIFSSMMSLSFILFFAVFLDGGSGQAITEIKTPIHKIKKKIKHGPHKNVEVIYPGMDRNS